MNLFSLDNNRVTYHPEALTIKEFKELWDRDKSPHKETAVEELSYVFYMTDYKSVYMSYDVSAREQKIIQDVITKKGWKADDKIKGAVNKYNELQQTPSMSLLKDAETALDKIRTYFRNVDITNDEDGKITSTLISNIEKLGKVITSLAVLRGIVDKEISETRKLRGSGEIGMRELPKRNKV